MLEIVLIVIIGTIVGSFLSVCIDRVPQGKSVILPRSHCDMCGQLLGWCELVPVVSYLMQGGRCRTCGAKIPIGELGVEMATGIGFGMLYGIYGISIEMLWAVTFFCIGIILSLIDAKHMLLPTCIIHWGILIGLIEIGVWTTIDFRWQRVAMSLLGALLGYGLFMLIYYGDRAMFKRKALGEGDVRLMGLCGWYTGLDKLWTALVIGTALASIFGGILWVIRKQSKPFPLGPFLCFGTIVTLILEKG